MQWLTLLKNHFDKYYIIAPFTISVVTHIKILIVMFVLQYLTLCYLIVLILEPS